MATAAASLNVSLTGVPAVTAIFEATARLIATLNDHYADLPLDVVEAVADVRTALNAAGTR